MEAIVLAGGPGTRLRSVIADVPKPMAPINGRPFLEYLLDYLEAEGVTRAVLAVSYRREMIESHLQNRYRGIELAYSVEAERCGTGGGILQALEQARTSDVLVLNGDTLFTIDVGELLSCHGRNAADLTVALRVMPDCTRYGRVELDSTGQVSGFLEKQAQTAGAINGGLYLLRREWMLSQSWPRLFSFEKDVLEAKYGTARFFGVPFDRYFIDIGIPEDYRRAQEELPALKW